MIKKLTDSAFKFQMDTDYNRIKNGKRLNLVNKPYDLEFINNMIIFYENSEEYEKYSTIIELKNSILDHENNYLLSCE